MLLELYILFVVLAFVFFFLALYFSESWASLFNWPICIILFGALFFASFNIETSDTFINQTIENTTVIDNSTTILIKDYTYQKNTQVFTEQAFAWFYLGLCALCIILFLWDIWSKKMDDTPDPKVMDSKDRILDSQSQFKL